MVFLELLGLAQAGWLGEAFMTLTVYFRRKERKYLGEVFDESEIQTLAPLRDLLGQGMLEVGLAPGK